MISKISSLSPTRVIGICKRFCHYSLVGGSTYAFDLALIFLFRSIIGLPDWLSVALGFIIAVSVNFLLSYFWVYRGTKQTKTKGYLIFVGLAFAGLVIVVNGTLFLTSLGLGLYIARTIVGGLVGSTNFFINTFFNFKMVH